MIKKMKMDKQKIALLKKLRHVSKTFSSIVNSAQRRRNSLLALAEDVQATLGTCDLRPSQ
jgi:hypothetical protein